MLEELLRSLRGGSLDFQSEPPPEGIEGFELDEETMDKLRELGYVVR